MKGKKNTNTEIMALANAKNKIRVMKVLIIVAFRACIVYNFLYEAPSFQ